MNQRESQHLLERLFDLHEMPVDSATPRIPAQHSRLDTAIRLLSKRTQVVIAGLAGASQHAFAELLIGAELFKHCIKSASCPSITLRYGQMPTSYALRGENRMTFAGLSVTTALAGSMPDSLEIEMPNPDLVDFDLTILPACENAEYNTPEMVELLQSAQLIIWCSDAASAWHDEERALWASVSAESKQRCILALTSAERLSDEPEQQAYEAKRALLTDTFRHVSPIAIGAAKSAAPGGNMRDEMAFASSGAQSLFCQFKAHVALDREPALENARKLLAQIDTVSPAPKQFKPATPLPAYPGSASPIPAKNLQTVLLKGVRQCIEMSDNIDALKQPELFEAMDQMLSGIKTIIRDDLRLDRDHKLILKQLEEACELVGLLSFDEADHAAVEAADILRQITADLWNRLPSSAVETSTPQETISAAS